ncbi:hypothetical protein DEU56DRAFT_762409 [Suillus clintonianus]|uniref:uncharacterized protein n=1 Tax=Suillus clintonianus TaxID=1904413 RepID=UPI001B8683FE|nr:uncharacterized protein DEU56DRAFT_762409 [Suillus clintonianus]KAG2109543.1 hypothetical protein DEU56DRAFT_762409 [Suillus clintonianus]
MDSAAMFDSFLFDNPGLMPNSGNFVDLNDIDFIGYLSVGHGPTLYPLYCRPMLHIALTVHISLYAYVLTSIVHRSVFETQQMAEVPVYVNSFYAVNAQINFPAKSTRAGPDNRFYVVYDGVSSNVSSTVIHLARHPTGYYPWSHVDLTAFQAISDAPNSGSLLVIPGPALAMPGHVTAPDGANGDEHSIPGDPASAHASPTATSNSPTIFSWISCSGQMVHSAPASTHQSQADGGSTRTSSRQKAKKAAKAEGGLKNVIGRLPKWRKAFAYLRIQLRVSVCTGETGNPHLFNFESRAAAIQLAWPRALHRANIDSGDLEMVMSFKTGTYMTLESILELANPSLSEFVYDIKRLASYSIGDSHGGFGFDDLGAGVLLIDTVQRLLQLFIRPKSNILPISISKEIMWHIVFRPTTSHSVRLVLADLEPATFRSVEHPPFPTMSLLGSNCYAALLEKYSTLTNIPVDLLIQYPTPAEVYDQLCETAVILVNEHDDEDHPGLMSSLAKLCNIS